MWYANRRCLPRVAMAALFPLLGAACGDPVSPVQEIAFANCGSRLSFFAFQPASGPWTRVVPDSTGTVRFNPKTQTLGIAFSVPAGEFFYNTYVYYLTSAEFATLAATPCTIRPPTNRYWQGSVAGVATGERVYVTAGSAAATVTPSSSTAFTIGPLPAGSVDLVAQSENVSGALQPQRIIVRRGLNLPSNSVLPVLSFAAGGESQAIATHTLTLSGLTTGQAHSLTVGFLTAGGGGHGVFFSTTASNGARALYGVPAAMTQDGDLHELTLNATATGISRGASQYYRNPGDRSIPLGPQLATPTVSTLATSPDARLRAEINSQAEYGSFAVATFTQSGGIGFGQYFIQVVVSATHLGSTPAKWTLDVPDLSVVAGFPQGAGLKPGVTTSWKAAAYQGPVERYLGAPRKDATSLSFASQSGTTTSAPSPLRPDRP